MIPSICLARCARYRAVGAAIIMPAANTEAMNEHLKEISSQVAPGAHAVLVCDGAGWHQRGGKLKAPDNITLLSLPPYSPELNFMENVWDYLRGNELSHLVWDTYDAMVAACAKAWRFLIDDPDRIQNNHTSPLGDGQCISALVLLRGPPWPSLLPLCCENLAVPFWPPTQDQG